MFITRGRYIYSPSLNDKDDKNDKESEKSPMRVIGRGLWKPCHCCHSCHGRWACHGIGVDRAVLHYTALIVDGESGDHEGSQPLPVAACAVTHSCIALFGQCLAKLNFGAISTIILFKEVNDDAVC